MGHYGTELKFILYQELHIEQLIHSIVLSPKLITLYSKFIKR